MFQILQILTTVLVAVAMAPALAHALEYPGKMRLSRDAYLTVQPIYYPGFTIAGGIAEAGGLLASIVLLVFTPRGTVGFWLTCAAVLGMIGMQIVFWIYTQPANRFWLESVKIGNLGAGFFAVNPAGRPGTENDAADWRRLRDRWEYSHIVRAGLVFLSFLFLLLAMEYE
jgi:anthrone oxygenase-like protein